jgi:putative oxidoreductase
VVNLALVILRAIVGSLMLGHGAQNLFGWWGGYSLDGTSAWLESMGLRPAGPGPSWLGAPSSVAGCCRSWGCSTRLVLSGS